MNDNADFLQLLMTTIAEHAGKTKPPDPESQTGQTIPCPNCKTALSKQVVKNKVSSNVGRPFAFCQQCCDEGKICFWFLDHGLCDCGCPMYQAEAKKGKNVGRKFEGCSANCKGKFRWL